MNIDKIKLLKVLLLDIQQKNGDNAYVKSKYFTSAFFALADIIKTTETEQQSSIDELMKKAQEMIDAAGKELIAYNTKFTEDVARLNSKIDEVETNSKITDDSIKSDYEVFKTTIKNGVDGKDGVNGLDGKDGKDADIELAVEKVYGRIKLPTYEQFILKGEDIVNEINDLPIEEKYQIDAKHIKNLPKYPKGFSISTKYLSYLVDVDLSNLTKNAQGQYILGSGSGTGAVSSVFGRTGDVVATAGDYTTTLVPEGTNLYYTAARFNTAFAAKTTTDLAEGTNLYYTQTRFDTAFAAKSTTDLAEGTNKYFTNARAIASTLTGYTSGAGTISSSDTILTAIQKLNGNIAGISTGLTVGTTTITSGATTRILYDNAGVLGEYTISGTGTVVAMAASPIFTNPTLGIANATSLGVSGIITTGANGGTNGSITFSGSTSGSTVLQASTTAGGTLTLPTVGGTLASTANNLSVFAATTSAQLAGVISDETGSGALVFATNPTITLASASTAVTQTALDNSTKIATTAYVDAATSLNVQNFKLAVISATTGPLPANTYNNGTAGVGATITMNTTGVVNVDNIQIIAGQRILINNESIASHNGIYLATASSGVGLIAVLTRATDADQPSELYMGASMVVTNGTINGNTVWSYGGVNTPTFGTSSIFFTLTSALYQSGTGLTLSSTRVFAIDSTVVTKTDVQTLTNKDLTSGTNTFPTFNQNTTGSAAKWTTARLLAGNSVDGSANVPFANKFIVQGTTDAGLTGAQFLGALGTGILKNTTTTGVLSIAVAADFPTLNQNTTGSAAKLTTARTINGTSFDGTANIIIPLSGFTTTATRVPYGNSTTGALTSDASFTRNNGAGANLSTFISATDGTPLSANLSLDTATGSQLNFVNSSGDETKIRVQDGVFQVEGVSNAVAASPVLQVLPAQSALVVGDLGGTYDGLNFFVNSAVDLVGIVSNTFPEAFYFDTGNFGVERFSIGGQNPDTAVPIFGNTRRFEISGASAVMSLNSYGATLAETNIIQLNQAGGSIGAPSTVSTGKIAGGFLVSGYGDTAYQVGGYQFFTISDPTPSDTAMGTDWKMTLTYPGTTSFNSIIEAKGTTLVRIGDNDNASTGAYFEVDGDNATYKMTGLAAPGSDEVLGIDSTGFLKRLGFVGQFIGVQYATPTTGSTVTSDGSPQLIMNPAGALLTLTVVFPSSPQNGQIFNIASTQPITTLTLSGGTILAGLTTIGANGFAGWVYSSTAGEWIRKG